MPDVWFDRAKYGRLKHEYARARGMKLESFEFEGTELLTGYAKYLLEYLRLKFRDDGAEGPTEERAQ